jgi:hypothetical protein
VARFERWPDGDWLENQGMRTRFNGTNAQFNEHMEKMAKRQATSEEIVKKSPEGSALAKLRDHAEKLMDRSPALTFAQALAQATLEHPKLYDQYLDEGNH